ncbi:uncharacterized protein TNCV_2185081 [Trichonephila clavipes]|nr:uncharacterized protein TNCV_2185081 [Trichonephila clavipes]
MSSLAMNLDSISGDSILDDNRVCVWKVPGECLDPAFALQQHTAPTVGVTVWGAVANHTQPHLELIHGTMTAQRYVHDILQPHVLSHTQQDNARPQTARVLQDFLHTVTTLPCLPNSQICLQSSICGIIWDSELGILLV